MPNEVLFKLVNYYKKEFIRHYYQDLFNRFITELKSSSFWISIFYNKSYGIIINMLSYFFFVPLFRFIKVIIICLNNLIYSFYFICINFIFDLIIKYVDVYARKLRVFYERSLIDEINEVRRILLFINVKKNFKKIFRPSKKITVKKHVYTEEWYIRYHRIFFDVLLFFIWHMPLILGFISYIVRVIFSLIWGQILIVFWFFAKKFMRRFRKFYIWIRFTRKVYWLKFRFLYKSRRRMVSNIKRKSILKINKFFAFITLFMQKLYDNISIFFKPRNKFLIILKLRVGFFFNYIILLKSRDLRLFETNKIRFRYYSLLKKTYKILITRDVFFNFFFYLKQYIDNIFINRLQPFDYYVNMHTNRRNLNKLYVLLLGSVYHKLNLDSIYNMVHKFISTDNFGDHDERKFKYKYTRIYVYRLKIYRILILIYWEIIFPIYIFFFRITVFLLFRLYIIICFFFYLLFCLFYFLLCFL